MPRNKPRPSTYLPRRFPWLTGKKTRAERVIAFLEYLPITKGILRGKKMRLLPHQREFVERVYSGNVRLAVSSVARGTARRVSLPDWSAATCSVLKPSRAVRFTVRHAAPSRPHSSLLRSRPLSRACLSSSSSASRPRRSGSDGGEGGPGKGTVYAVLSGEKEAAHGLAPSLWIYDELGHCTRPAIA